jgi:hypothetical protein
MGYTDKLKQLHGPAWVILWLGVLALSAGGNGIAKFQHAGIE